MPDECISIPLDKLAGVAVEHWRLQTALTPLLDKPASAPLRHALRKIEDFLRGCEISVQAMDGLPYDAGLAAKVADSVPDSSLPRGSAVIAETLSPLVLHRQRLNHGRKK
jgi:hypothetical protein